MPSKQASKEVSSTVSDFSGVIVFLGAFHAISEVSPFVLIPLKMFLEFCDNSIHFTSNLRSKAFQY